MFSFQEIGAIIRLIFIYHFNISRMNLVHKNNKEKEDKNDLYTGLFFVLSIILIGFVTYFGKSNDWW